MHPRGGNPYQSSINHLRVAEVLNFDGLLMMIHYLFVLILGLDG
jgi:hypothetical protein